MPNVRSYDKNVDFLCRNRTIAASLRHYHLSPQEDAGNLAHHSYDCCGNRIDLWCDPRMDLDILTGIRKGTNNCA